MRTRLAVLLALGVVTPLAAQSKITVGGTATGRLALADSQFSDGSRYRAYLFTAARGDTVVAELDSDDFDAMVLLTDDVGNKIVANDDAGGRCNARVQQVLPAAGGYRVYANSRTAHGLGDYELRLLRGPRPAPPDTTCRHFLGVRGIIQIGETLSSVLTNKDLHFDDSTYFRRYTLPLRAKQTFTVDLRSSDVDAFLLLENGRGEQLVKNDDGGGGCHARIVYTARDNHPLVVVANTAVPHQAGNFTLSVVTGAIPSEPKSTCRVTAGAIAVGQTRSSTLTTRDRLLTADSTYAQQWRLDGREGAQVTIDLETSEFDPFLFVIGPGIETPLQDDNSGGSCNARLTFSFPETGEYFIVVNTVGKLATGRFTLGVTGGQKAPSSSRCNPGR